MCCCSAPILGVVFGIELTLVVGAARSALAGTFVGSTLLWGVLWTVLLFALALWWGTRVFRKEIA